jgi:hypothetical protein
MDKTKRSDDTRQPGDATPAKKPYVKPSFRHERVFETMALACGKVNPTQLQCRVNRKNS